jgi:hypothetical protein
MHLLVPSGEGFLGQRRYALRAHARCHTRYRAFHWRGFTVVFHMTGARNRIPLRKIAAYSGKSAFSTSTGVAETYRDASKQNLAEKVDAS